MRNIFFNKYYKKVEGFKKEPHLIQDQVLFNLLLSAEETDFFDTYPANLNNFKEVVPINTYEDLFPFIEKILQGDEDILWPGNIKYIAKSSGTTGVSKFIPVSPESLKDCHYRGSRFLLSTYLKDNPLANFWQGFNFFLGGNIQNEAEYRGKFISDISVILMSNSPWWVNLLRTPKLSLAIMPNWEEKINEIAKVISRKNLVSLSGVPSWLLVLVKKVLEISGKKDLSEVWPNLRLFIHGGVNFAPYRQQFEELISNPDMQFLEVYNASEGFFAWQDDPARRDLLLSLDNGIYYEFMPLSELNKEKKQTLSLTEVEMDKDYALIISTNSGLWRYLIGDVVRFTSLKPYRIILSGRTKGFINLAGEELMEFSVEEAITEASRLTGAIINNYTVAPLIQKDKVGCHQYLIEFAKQPTDLLVFIEKLDNKLQALNSDYKAKRTFNLNLGLPEIIIAKPGLFEDWLKKEKKLGGQNKVPRLSNNRNFIEKLI